MHYLDQYKGMTRQIYLVCITRTILGLGSMSNVFSTLQMRSILGLKEAQIGLVVSAASIMAMSSTLLGGRLADRIGRKKTCLISTVLACTSYALSYFYCRKPLMVLLIILNQCFGNLAYPVFTAIVGDEVKNGRMQIEAFSLLYMSSNLGFAIGPSIGGMLYYNHLELVYILQLTMTLVSASFFQFFTRENYDPAEARRQAAQELHTGAEDKDVSILTIFRQHTALPVLFITMAIVTMCYQMVNFMLTMQMSDYFGDIVASRYSGFIWTVNCLCIVFFTPVIITETKKHHQFRNMFFGLLLYTAGFGSYAFLRRPWLFLLFGVIWSLGEIMISTGVGAFIASNSPPSHLARCQSLYEASRYIGRAAGPTLFGFLLGFISYSTAWIINAGICLASAFFMLAMYRVYSARKE